MGLAEVTPWRESCRLGHVGILPGACGSAGNGARENPPRGSVWTGYQGPKPTSLDNLRPLARSGCRIFGSETPLSTRIRQYSRSRRHNLLRGTIDTWVGHDANAFSTVVTRRPRAPPLCSKRIWFRIWVESRWRDGLGLRASALHGHSSETGEVASVLTRKCWAWRELYMGMDGMGTDQ